jgi:hypothetical protein
MDSRFDKIENKLDKLKDRIDNLIQHPITQNK